MTRKGIIGVSISYHLAERGVKTTVVDRAGIASCAPLLNLSPSFFLLHPPTSECFLEFYLCEREPPQIQAFSTRQAERLVDFWPAIGILEHPQMSFPKRALTCMRSPAVTVSSDFPCHQGSARGSWGRSSCLSKLSLCPQVAVF